MLCLTIVFSGVPRIFRTSGHFYKSITQCYNYAGIVHAEFTAIFLKFRSIILLFFCLLPSENPKKTEFFSPFDLWAFWANFEPTSGHLPRGGCAWIRH